MRFITKKTIAVLLLAGLTALMMSGCNKSEAGLPYDGNSSIPIKPAVPDTIPPVITLLGNPVMTVNLGSAYVEPGATALDDVDGDISSQIVISGNVDTTTLGTYTLKYNVTDAAGNAATEVVRTVKVEAALNTAPVITLTGDNPMDLQACDTFVDQGATAQDKEDGDLTSSITTSGSVDTSTPGSYTITYTVTDSGGLSDTKTRAVNVILPTSNVIKKTGQTLSYDEAGADFSDDCSLMDDGFYKVGKDIKYTRNNDMVTDNATGLIWEDTPHSGGIDNSNLLMIWSGTATPGIPQVGPAQNYCSNLTLGGLTWRLPEIWELLTIADKSRHNPSIDPIFQNIIAGPYSAERLYWTNTPKQEQGTDLGETTQINYNVKFVDGRDQNGLEGYVGNPFSVRCVSGTAVGYGVNPNSKTFTNNNDIITDNVTDLQWTDDLASSEKKVTWREAINYCEGLTLGGFDDWRLPNLNEYYSMVNSTLKPAYPAAFQRIKQLSHLIQYWTSSTVDEYKYSAWLFEFYRGTDTWSGKDVSLGTEPPASKPGNHRVMCVRNK